MNPKEAPELTVQALMSLRKKNDALRAITERLRVKEMGPADHIRTKHDVKAFVESGDETMAAALLKRADARRAEGLKQATKLVLKSGQRMAT